MLNKESVLEFDIKVSEEINKHNIKQFFSTFLKTNNIKPSPLIKVIYFYAQNIQNYHIFVFLNPKKKFFLPALFLSYLEDFTKQRNKSNLRLYICEDFFAIFENKNLIFVKNKKEQSSKADILSYVQKYLKLNLDKTFEINNKLLLKAKEDFLLQVKKKYKFEVLGLKVLSFENFKRIKVLSLFVVLLFSFNIGFFSYKFLFIHKEKINKTKISLNIPSKNQVKIFQNLKEFFLSQGIELRQVKLGKRIDLILRSKDKDKILKALNSFKKYKLILKEINYLQDKKNYEAFVFSK